MPKTIPLEVKIERLEKEIASLKEEHKAQKKDLRNENRRLRAKIGYLENKQSLSVDLSIMKFENLKNENLKLTENIASLKEELKKAQSESADKLRQSDRNKWTLVCFWQDGDTDELGHTFFDPKTLLITINPFTGSNRPEWTIDFKEVRRILSEDTDYQEALERVKPYVEKAKGGWTEEYAIIKEEGKKLLKKYIYLFSGYKY